MSSCCAVFIVNCAPGMPLAKKVLFSVVSICLSVRAKTDEESQIRNWHSFVQVCVITNHRRDYTLSVTFEHDL